MRLPALVVTPHSSGHLPADVLGQMLGGVLDLSARARRLRWTFDEGDPYTDLIFHAPRAASLHATVSRFVVDLNRDRDAGGPNGVVKLTDFEERPLYPPGFTLGDEEREARLRRYWDPFHAEIEATLAATGARFLVVGHSMQPRGPAVGPDPGQPRPAITLMTGGDGRGELLPGRDRATVPPEQARALHALLERHFAKVVAGPDGTPGRVALNDPWQTDTISRRYSDPGRARPVPGFGIEVNRALYLRSEGGEEAPLEGAIRALNAAFSAFLEDAAGLFAQG